MDNSNPESSEFQFKYPTFIPTKSKKKSLNDTKDERSCKNAIKEQGVYELEKIVEEGEWNLAKLDIELNTLNKLNERLDNKIKIHKDVQTFDDQIKRLNDEYLQLLENQDEQVIVYKEKLNSFQIQIAEQSNQFKELKLCLKSESKHHAKINKAKELMMKEMNESIVMARRKLLIDFDCLVNEHDSLNSQLELSKQKNDELESVKTILMNKLNDGKLKIQSKANELLKSIDTKAKTNEDLNRIIDNKSKMLNEAELKLVTKRNENSILKEEIVRLINGTNEVGKLETTIQEYKEKYEFYESGVNEKKKMIENLNLKMLDKQSQYDANQSLIESKQMEINCNEQLIADKQSQLELNKNEIVSIENEINNKQAQLDAIETQIVSIEKQINEKRNKNASLDNEKTDYKLKLENVKSLLAERKNALSNKEKINDELRENIEQLKLTLNVLEPNHSSIEIEHFNLTEDLKKLYFMKKKMDKNEIKRKEKIAQIKSEVESIDLEITKTKESIQSKSNQIQEIEDKLAITEKNSQESFKDLCEKFNDLIKMREEYNKEIKEKDKMIEVLKKKNSDYRHTIEKLESEQKERKAKDVENRFPGEKISKYNKNIVSTERVSKPSPIKEIKAKNTSSPLCDVEKKASNKNNDQSDATSIKKVLQNFTFD
ncbi:hypothetical protein RDWZM_010067 [Blomia tropicalis]|uniref:Uncharacterized protein n=1 Tax=Blomia tropicalis TaxID=40697 RepID=A0A9Q0M1A8_BLOTA|nr:hypothetical protein RDWZM_010067 [Blomia tropicalis]